MVYGVKLYAHWKMLPDADFFKINFFEKFFQKYRPQIYSDSVHSE